jgi:16S rRNA (cytosine1402-N4)-methyltransferase
VGGVLADLGVSSFQLDDPGRGFSFAHDGPLDMRLDTTGGVTAADLVRDLSEEQLVELLRGSDEPHARRIARAIAQRRREEPVTRTSRLAEIVRDARPADRRARAPVHPATLTFQALRMAVNREVEGLEAFVADAVSSLAPGGRLVVISFHRGEDAAIKHALRELPRADVQVLTKKPLRPSDDEVAANPRSRSARLRAAERAA